MDEEATVAAEIQKFPLKQGAGRVSVVEDDSMVRDLTVAMLE
jgi:hypothetical protein